MPRLSGVQGLGFFAGMVIYQDHTPPPACPPKESQFLTWALGRRAGGLLSRSRDTQSGQPACWKYRNSRGKPISQRHREWHGKEFHRFSSKRCRRCVTRGLRSHQPRTQSERLVRRMCRCPSAEELVAVTVSLGLAAETGTLWLPATSLRMSAPACTSSTSTTIESS